MKYNTKLECIDWRYSAAIVGLAKYFKYFEIQFNDGYDDKGKEVDYIEYNSEDITLERFLEFSEYYFAESMPHKFIENALEQDEFSDDYIKLINTKLSEGAIMKKIFGKIKFDGTNGKEIKNLIDSNRQILITETFKNKKYDNYCNKKLFFSESQSICRLVGYYVDPNRKTKSISYNFNVENFVGTDRIEFDFIVFAFTNSYEALFINNNSSIRRLIRTNDELHKIIDDNKETKKGSTSILFEEISKSTDFIDYDVEVISKHRDNDYYSTLFIRKDAIEVFQSINKFEYISLSYKVNDNYYINIQKEVINCILNQLLLDRYIELLLKDEKNYNYIIRRLIEINVKILEQKEGKKYMYGKIKEAYNTAEKVKVNLKKKNIDEHKIKAYRIKLTSAIIANDKDRVCNILLQLSNFSDVPFKFAYDLYEDFENNKKLVHAFTMALEDDLQDNKEDNK